MFDNTEVNPRINKRHPELPDSDVLDAWRNAFVIIERRGVPLPDTIFVGIGSDAKGRLIEMVATITVDEKVHIFHAMTPPSAKTLKEVGLDR